MNNQFPTWFPASEAGPQNGSVLSMMEWAVRKNEDPIDLWRQHQMVDGREMSHAEIAAILQCPQAVYERHVLGQNTLPYSPLTGRHVLNFCKHIGVHPGDMVSSEAAPEFATPPHIYDAICLTKASGNKDDRAWAHVCIEREKARFRLFLEQNPAVADYFKDMREHAKLLSAQAASQDYLLANIRGIKQDNLRKTFKRAFKHTAAHDLYDGRQHAEDFHLLRRAALTAREELIFTREIMNSENEAIIHIQALALYGHRADGVLHFMRQAISNYKEAQISTARSITLLTTAVKTNYPVVATRPGSLRVEFSGRAARAESDISRLCATSYAHHTQMQEVPDAMARLRSDLRGLAAFEAWQESTQRPEHFYINHLYCNYVASKRPVAPVTIPALASDLSLNLVRV